MFQVLLPTSYFDEVTANTLIRFKSTNTVFYHTQFLLTQYNATTSGYFLCADSIPEPPPSPLLRDISTPRPNTSRDVSATPLDENTTMTNTPAISSRSGILSSTASYEGVQPNSSNLSSTTLNISTNIITVTEPMSPRQNASNVSKASGNNASTAEMNPNNDNAASHTTSDNYVLTTPLSNTTGRAIVSTALEKGSDAHVTDGAIYMYTTITFYIPILLVLKKKICYICRCILRNNFNKTEAAFYPCLLCFLMYLLRYIK